MSFLKTIRQGAVAAIAVAGLSLAGAPASADVLTFALFDHEDGGQNPPNHYGLRIDHLNSFFSAGTGAANSTVTLTYDSDNGTIDLSGTMRRNTNPGVFDGTVWELDYRMSGVTNGSVGSDLDFGAFEGTATLVADTLTCISNCDVGDTAIELGAKAASDGLLFGFGAPGAGNDEFDVVRGGVMTAAGWIGPVGAPANRPCCNDFLLAGVQVAVPLPASILMLGAAMIGLGLLSRRRRNA